MAYYWEGRANIWRGKFAAATSNKLRMLSWRFFGGRRDCFVEASVLKLMWKLFLTDFIMSEIIQLKSQNVCFHSFNQISSFLRLKSWKRRCMMTLPCDDVIDVNGSSYGKFGKRKPYLFVKWYNDCEFYENIGEWIMA